MVAGSVAQGQRTDIPHPPLARILWSPEYPLQCGTASFVTLSSQATNHTIKQVATSEAYRLHGAPSLQIHCMSFINILIQLKASRNGFIGNLPATKIEAHRAPVALEVLRFLGGFPEVPLVTVKLLQ